MNKIKSRKKSGFTLIEMVVVIAIVVIIAAIAIPQALKAINKSKAATDVANARTYAGEIMNKIANGESINSEITEAKITNEIIGTEPAKSKLLKDGEFYYKLIKQGDKTGKDKDDKDIIAKEDTIAIYIKTDETGSGADKKSVYEEIYPNTKGDWAKYVKQ